jgi:multidrug resistance efflux pump
MATIGIEQAQVQGIATLLILNDELRKLINLREFGFFTTNETHRLVPYHTAYLWEKRDLMGIHLIAQSGISELDSHAPTNQWLMETINKIREHPKAKEIHVIDFEHRNVAEISERRWPESLPHFAMWCPLLTKSNQLTGGLILFRDTEFSESEIKMLTWLIASYQYTWRILIKPPRISLWQRLKEKPYFITVLILLGIIFLFPIRLSVLATATVTAKDPVMINAPMQGVIKSFAVSPGERVAPGQLLVILDKTDLQATASVSRKDLQLTAAKLRTAINEGLNDPQSRAEIPVLQAQLAVDNAHLNYANELLSKANMVSPIAGLVVFDSKEDLAGQPVRAGERILTVADPNHVQLKISLAVSDVIKLEPGNTGEFFLYGQFSGISVKLRTLGYNAKLLPNKILAYQLIADFTDTKNTPQLGATGTVRLYGHRVPFIYYLIRRPLQALRQRFGI